MKIGKIKILLTLLFRSKIQLYMKCNYGTRVYTIYNSTPHKSIHDYHTHAHTHVYNTHIHTHTYMYIIVSQMILCFVWPLQSSLPVSNVILVLHPTYLFQYKSYSNIHPMIRLD